MIVMLVAFGVYRWVTRPWPPPNVIVVLSDALRAANLPLYGYRRNTAPNLSDLAKESLVFDTHLAHYPGTSVSVSQLHTGRLMSPLLVSYKYIAVPVRDLPPDLFVLPRELGNAGYHTSLITAHYWMNHDDSWLLKFFRERHFVPTTVAGHAYAFFEELWPTITQFLEERESSGEPFFLYLHTFDTHGPDNYHEGFDQFRNAADRPEEINKYDSEIYYTDHWLGKLVAELKQRGLWENTVLLFTGDHGDEFNEAGPESWNSNHGPFARRSLLHVPLLVRLPHSPVHGAHFQGLTRHIDIAPTLAHLAAPGLDLSKYKLDGADLFSGGAPTGRTSFAFTPHYWGVMVRNLELTYDLWSGVFSPLYKAVPDKDNYPRLQVETDESLRNDLIEQLTQERDRRWDEFVAMPPNKQLPNPTYLGFLAPVLRVENPSEDGPVLENDPHDNRWTFDPTFLAVGPDEHPPSLTLQTPFVPGTYDVQILLQLDGIRAGLANDLTVQLGHEDNAPVHVRGIDANKDGWVEMGEQRIDKVLSITFSQPKGGVKLVALKLQRPEGTGPAAASVTPDEADRERLRALGY